MADAVARSENSPGIVARLVAFYHGVMAEMKKVTWPDFPQVRSATIAIIIFVLVQPDTGGGGDTPPPSNTSTTPPATPSGTPSSDRVDVVPANYVGQPFDEVEQALIGLDLVVARADGPAATTPEQAGTVSSITPTGRVTKGTTITVSVYRDFVNPSAPATPSAPAGPHMAGDDVEIQFPTYGGCPSGHALQGYNFDVQNGTFPGGNPVSAGATTLTINLTATGTTTVAYTALCSDGITSNPSGTLSITVS